MGSSILIAARHWRLLFRHDKHLMHCSRQRSAARAVHVIVWSPPVVELVHDVDAVALARDRKIMVVPREDGK
ncbi:hypothetical protein FXV83_41120 [Bradyrhizobium hipponense]|uniref:Uncharacterized protein n=1 Tax=Bradyrhizobium hipponense TaxID=2605638 RepID=A0A5S4YB50_9BRAD|nr:hypothetical protein [Bradyrhizobium hipponense]TYO60914.1 hypothetical protein FXV83_41120 [Bradyrhizobium hipponense]